MAKLRMPFGRRKSGGVAVTPRVHALIARANALRGNDWPGAALGYAAVVAEAPDLKHIWIQLGHATKEAGDFAAAETAYARAAALDTLDPEPLIHLGHLTKMIGRGREAMDYYLRAFALDPERADTVGEVQLLLHRGGPGPSRDTLIAALRDKLMIDVPEPAAADLAALDAALARARRAGLPDDQVAALDAARAVLARVDPAPAPTGAFEGTAVVFDASDLITYFKNVRMPTGIQRVQIAAMSNALANRPAGSVRICCFSDQDDNWTEVPADAFRNLCVLALESGNRNDPEWLRTLTRLHLTLRVTPPFEFPDGAFLVNLGSSWWLKNYFLFVREAKRKHGIRYVPFVHDMIPIILPETCVKVLVEDFISWALGAFQHADFFLVNSEATKRDLVMVAGMLGHEVDADRIAVIPLDADFRREPTTEAAQLAGRLSRWRLQPGGYVLFVSTIEPRKNHIGVFEAWIELTRRHGVKRVPKLVCVGHPGWLNDAIHARIAADPILRERVVMLSQVSDDELAMLYRDCRFTLYPSDYEGWGLPVTESLCYGKVALVADNSSLPEAGGSFAEYFTTGSTRELTDGIERLILDDEYLRTREAHIAAEFRPRRWQDIADQIVDELEAFTADAGGDGGAAEVAESVLLGQSVILGEWYPLERNAESRIWKGLASAEMFRIGNGWWWPEPWGCRTKPGGGEIALRIPRAPSPLRLYVKLLAPPGSPGTYRVSVDEAGVSDWGTIEPEKTGWAVLDIADPEDRTLTVRIEGSASFDMGEPSGGSDARIVSLGLVGFAICAVDDHVARARIAEAGMMDRLDTIAFNREPESDPTAVSGVRYSPTARA